jgi:hypothetical protein
MSDILTDAPNKLFLLKKEKMWGIVGMIFGGCILALILKMILPSLITILQQLFTAVSYGTGIILMIGLGLLAAILVIALVQNSGKIFTIVSKRFGKAIARLGPIELMEGFAHEYLDGKLAESEEGITGLDASVKEQDLAIGELQDGLQKANETATFLLGKTPNMDPAQLSDKDFQNWQLAVSEAEASEASIKRLEASRALLMELRDALDELHSTLEYNANYIRQTVRIQSIEFRGLKSGAKSAIAAKRTLVGGKALRDFNFAAEVAREEMSRMASEIDTALMLTKKFTGQRAISMEISSEKMRARIQNLRFNAQQLAASAKAKLDNASSADNMQQITDHARATKPASTSTFRLRSRR